MIKKKTYLPTLFLFLSLSFAYGQSHPAPFEGVQSFEMKEADTTYIMQQYFICFLKTGPKRDQDEETAAQIQKAHLAHLDKLAKEDKICMAGPFGDDGEIRGITVFRVATLEEARALANADPAVKAGRLQVEIHPWWAARGSKLY